MHDKALLGSNHGISMPCTLHTSVQFWYYYISHRLGILDLAGPNVQEM